MSYPTNPDDATTRPTYLRNITQALFLDENDNVAVRTGFTGNIIISGNVNIPGNIDAHISEIGTSGNLTVPYMPIAGNITIDTGQSVGISGNVNIGTMPNVNANITGGNVTVTQGTSPWVVSGNVGVTGTSNVALGGTNLDAFGRLRVSNPVTLFDSQNRYIDSGQFSNITATGGNVVYVCSE